MAVDYRQLLLTHLVHPTQNLSKDTRPSWAKIQTLYNALVVEYDAAVTRGDLTTVEVQQFIVDLAKRSDSVHRTVLDLGMCYMPCDNHTDVFQCLRAVVPGDDLATLVALSYDDAGNGRRLQFVSTPAVEGYYEWFAIHEFDGREMLVPAICPAHQRRHKEALHVDVPTEISVDIYSPSPRLRTPVARRSLAPWAPSASVITSDEHTMVELIGGNMYRLDDVVHVLLPGRDLAWYRTERARLPHRKRKRGPKACGKCHAGKYRCIPEALVRGVAGGLERALEVIESKDGHYPRGACFTCLLSGSVCSNTT